MNNNHSLAVTAGMASAAPRETGLPLYVQAHGASVFKDGECLNITRSNEAPVIARLMDVSQLVLMGNVAVTTPCLHAMMRRNIPISWHSADGWFVGHTIGLGHNDVSLRLAQYRVATGAEETLKIARELVAAKILCCRTMLRRRGATRLFADNARKRMRRLAHDAETVDNIDQLRGIEGTAASLYFSRIAQNISPPRRAEIEAFQFERRSRRPPSDRVNAMLSFAYALLLRHWSVALSATGFDALLGFYHRPLHGRPALALDMMEPFRPLLADSAVITAINNGEISAGDFEMRNQSQDGSGVFLSANGRRVLIAAFERRLDQEVTPAHLGYALSYRRLFAVQCRILAQFLLGTRDDIPQFVPR